MYSRLRQDNYKFQTIPSNIAKKKYAVNNKQRSNCCLSQISSVTITTKTVASYESREVNRI